jgi:predicted dehydrogenase
MTSTPIRLGIVGLGGMGRVLFNAALPHPDFVVTRAADLDPDTIARLRADHPDVAFSTEPSDVIGADAVDAVYIATSPGTHASFAVPALEAGQAVFCGKPLAVSAADGDAMASAARASGRAAVVNFSLSDRQSTRYVEAAIVYLSGVVGAGPRTCEWVLRGSRQSCRLRDWRDLFVAEGNGWQAVELTGELGSEATRLSLFARSIRGEETPDLADFATAHRVQQVVEAFHQDA